MTINTNSIFPIFRGKNFNDPYDGTTFKVVNPTPPANPPLPNYVGSNTLLDTVWEPSAGVNENPAPLPPFGMTLQEMRDRRDPSTGVPNPLYPTVAPGLFEEDGSAGFQYGEIAVMGCKVTAHWVPLVSDLDTQTAGDPDDGTVDAMQTEESRLFAFMHTTGQGRTAARPQTNPADWGTPNAFVDHQSTWENDLALLPYVKCRTITGNTSQAKVGPQGVAAVTKLGNGAVLEYKTAPGTIHGTTIRDEKQLWSQNTAAIASSPQPTVAKFQHPLQRDYLTIGITKSLSNGQRRCPPSGKLELRIEQIIKCRQPMSTRTVLDAQQAPAAGAAGPNPGGGGNFFPGGPTSAGRLGATLGTIAGMSLLG